MCDVTFDMFNNDIIVHEKNVEPWKVTLVDTGENAAIVAMTHKNANMAAFILNNYRSKI